MAINLNRLDAIRDYDEAIDALEDYIEELVTEFTQSPEGQAYLEAHSDAQESVGSWIDSLLHFGYAYESVTLPHMTKQTVDAIVTRLFPSKITLMDDSDADATIPELIAFWEFLKRSYKHPQATRILTFLKEIQPKFKGIMTDPKNFGMAKSFVTAGMTAGFDMTTEAGLRAFQAQYNESLQASNAPPPGLEMLLGNLGNPPANGPNPGNIQDLMRSLASVIQSLPPEAIEEEFGDIRQQLQVDTWRNAADRMPISENDQDVLTQQTITETEPGTILKDFQALLDFIGEAGIPVSGTNHLIAAKLLAEFNQRLSDPIQIDLKRPVQKSHSPINGLYLLLRTTGLGQVITKGKKPHLILNSEVLAIWNQLNPTEKYFTLLEAWLIRASEETLGERRNALSEGSKCVDFWSRLPAKGQKYRNYSEQQSLNYWPEYHNLALMRMFGLLTIDSGKPDAGKGWRIKGVQRSPFGAALMSVVIRTFYEQGMVWESETNPGLPFADLQPALQPYFPEWQTAFKLPGYKFRPGVYIFKVSLDKIWRRLAISSNLFLDDLSGLILGSVDFDSDHLDMFTYKNQMGQTVEISHPYAESSPCTDEVQIGDLPLAEGASMTYVFDFGDWWEFTVQLEKIQADDTRSNYAEILESYGANPEQYPMWDDDE
jgi:hypothetical protein